MQHYFAIMASGIEHRSGRFRHRNLITGSCGSFVSRYETQTACLHEELICQFILRVGKLNEHYELKLKLFMADVMKTSEKMGWSGKCIIGGYFAGWSAFVEPPTHNS